MAIVAAMMNYVQRESKSKSGATIYDIAKLAGVNPSTVSRALTKPGRVSEATRERVEAAAAQLNYRANTHARALPTGRTRMLGLIVADITNPSFFDVIRGAETMAASAGYTMLLADAAESATTEATIARRMLSAADGIILASPRMSDAEILELNADKPVVVINRDIAGVTSVVPNVAKGIGEAVRSLGAEGHTSIAYVAGPRQSWMSGRRWDAVREAGERYGLDTRRLDSERPTVEGGRQVAPLVVQSGASAVLCYNDLLALGILRELQATRVDVPGRMSVIGFDDIFGADLVTPALSTVRLPHRDSGVGAMGAMLKVLDDVARPARLEVDTEFVPRGSSGAPA
ncbi:LacI family DNA-binding transcriptional regulator [Micrococcales bacterium 31B]|nr:LacI family DNA-binding transcriptional regulator [Micrococcales bacterium 31B]